MTKMTNEAGFLTVGLLAAIAVFFLWYVWWRSKARGLSPVQKEELWAHWHKVLGIDDPHRKVLEAEKVVDHAMRMLGFHGGFADKLKKIGPRLSDEQGVWNAHKLRNRIAHEVDVSVSGKEADRAAKAFEKALRDLC